jgi:hypothetical protein
MTFTNFKNWKNLVSFFAHQGKEISTPLRPWLSVADCTACLSMHTSLSERPAQSLQHPLGFGENYKVKAASQVFPQSFSILQAEG